MRYLFSFKKF